MEVILCNDWDLKKGRFATPPYSKLKILQKPTRDCESGDFIALEFNTIKAKLDHLSHAAMMDARTSSDSFIRLCSLLKKDFSAVHCNRGWLKMYEILASHSLMATVNQQRLVPPRTVLALFNCELPGGFLSAAHHFAQDNNFDLHWWASSLYPLSLNSALYDSFGLMQKYPSKWLMSREPSQNGDMTDVECISSLSSKTKAAVKDAFPRLTTHKVDLYVSDGGMDIQQHYSHQESMHQALILGELMVCLNTLVKGGNAVIKLYSFCHDFTRSWLVATCCMFKEARFFKPLTSRPLNTEIYLVLKSYRGRCAEFLDYLSLRLPDVKESSDKKQNAKALFDMTSPELASFNTGCERSPCQEGDQICGRDSTQSRSSGDQKGMEQEEVGFLKCCRVDSSCGHQKELR